MSSSIALSTRPQSIIGNFASEFGSSLDELGQEYDEMIINFEDQKSRLRDFSPQEKAIEEEDAALRNPPPSPTPSNSSSRSSRGVKGGIKGVFASAGIHLKRKLSNRGPSTAHRHSPIIRRREKSSASQVMSEKSSIDGDLDVFANSQEEEHSTNSLHRHFGLCSPKQRDTRSKGSSEDDHVLVPPVLVNGELKSDYQYLSPQKPMIYDPKEDKKNKKNHKVGRSNSFAKESAKKEFVIKFPKKKQKDKKAELSPLKALYDATVLGNNGTNTADANMVRRSST